MEPIKRVTGPSGALEPVSGVYRLAPIERDEHDPDPDRRRRRPREPERPAIERDDDGRPHVDVKA